VLATGGWYRLGQPGSSYRWFQRTFAGFRWPPLLFFLIGTAVILIGPCIYYARFNEKAQRAYDPETQEVDFSETGIFWVQRYNAGRDWTDLLRYTSTAFLYNWEWPHAADEPYIRERTLKLLKGSAIGLAGLCALGIFPWRRLFSARRDGPAHTLPTLWLAVWIILPAYCF
jgi:hypothetical protein